MYEVGWEWEGAATDGASVCNTERKPEEQWASHRMRERDRKEQIHSWVEYSIAPIFYTAIFYLCGLTLYLPDSCLVFVFSLFSLWMLKDWWRWRDSVVTQHCCTPGQKSWTDRGTHVVLFLCVCVVRQLDLFTQRPEYHSDNNHSSVTQNLSHHVDKWQIFNHQLSTKTSLYCNTTISKETVCKTLVAELLF